MAWAQETHAHLKAVVETQLSYTELCARFEGAIGRLDVAKAEQLVGRSAPWPDVEAAMREMAGDAGLMLFAVFDQGAVASLGGEAVRCRLYIVGNPAVAARIVRIDARGALYVPFRVAVYAAPGDGAATIAFDRPSSLLAGLSGPRLDEIGRMLDQEIDAAVRRATAGGAPPSRAAPAPVSG